MLNFNGPLAKLSFEDMVEYYMKPRETISVITYP